MVERGRSAAHWSEVARRAEALGYDTLLMPDHITDQLAPMLALTAAAEATKTLRVGSFVFANDYRNPVLLSREAATLDLLSGGRLEFGIGAGWKTSDYEQLGIPYEPPKTAVVATPFLMYGSRASLVEDLLERRARLGISYIALPGRAMRAFAPVVAELRGK